MLTGCGGGSSSSDTASAGTPPTGVYNPGGGTSTGNSSAGGTSASSGTAGITPTQKPAIQGTAPTTAAVGQAYSFQPQASGGSGNLTFTVANKPSWATFDSGTGQLSGTPTASDVGTTSGVEISVTDGTSVVSLPAFSITVAASSVAQSSGSSAAPGTVTISWQPPTENTDGSPLTTLAGFDIHYGTQSQNYTSTVKVSNPGLATYVLQNLSPGTYYFVVTAYDSSGAESDYSQEVTATVN